MFGFFKSKPRPMPVPAAVSRGADANPKRQPVDIQRELVQVVLGETLKLHGIPRPWIRSEVLGTTGADGSAMVVVQLIIQQWSENLVRHCFALERQLLQRLARYEPGKTTSRFTVSWRFAENCGCPVVNMPSADVWATKSESRTGTAQPDLFDRRSRSRSATPAVVLREGDGEPERENLFAPTSMSPLSD